MKYAVIQDAGANVRTFQVIRLEDNATLSPAGYVVGSYSVVASGISINEARDIAASMERPELNDDYETCQHCGEVSHLSGLIGEDTNNCPRCGFPILV